MGAGPDELEEGHDLAHVVVETERTVLEADVACVEPVDDVDVVIGHQRPNGGTQQGGEVAGQRGDQQHLGLGLGTSLAKWRSVENGVARTTSSCTATRRPPTTVWSIPNAGRSWVSRDRLIISKPADSRRANGLSVQVSGNPSIDQLTSPAQARAGAVRSRCAW